MARKELGPASLTVAQAVRASLADVSGPVVLGVSGGVDSLALAAGVAWAQRRLPVHATAVVVDHQLQPGSDDVARRAAQQCRDLGLAAVIETVDVVRTAAGLEADAREARRAALLSHDGPVLLGHTLDDQAETVLLGLARGSGTRSLAGMAPVAGRIRRPLLGVRRATTEAACSEQGLDAWCDPHNRSDEFARVRVRGTIMPLLEQELGPGIAEALARTAVLTRADADALDDLADAVIRDAGLVHDVLPVAVLEPLAPAIASRVLRRWLLARGAVEPGATHVDAVARLVTAWHGQGPIHVPGLQVVRDGSALRAVQCPGACR